MKGRTLRMDEVNENVAEERTCFNLIRQSYCGTWENLERETAQTH